MIILSRISLRAKWLMSKMFHMISLSILVTFFIIKSHHFTIKLYLRLVASFQNNNGFVMMILENMSAFPSKYQTTEQSNTTWLATIALHIYDWIVRGANMTKRRSSSHLRSYLSTQNESLYLSSVIKSLPNCNTFWWLCSLCASLQFVAFCQYRMKA